MSTNILAETLFSVRHRYHLLLFLLTLFLNNEVTAQSCEQLPGLVKKITLIQDDGGRVDWSTANNLVAFDRKDKSGYYNIYIMNPDGSNETCLSCDLPGLPGKNVGQPAWDPTGTYIVCQVEKGDHKIGAFDDESTNPGIGVYNDLWIIEFKSKKVYQLTDIPNDDDHATLHPHFSSDGKKLSWSEMYKKANFFAKGKEAGSWKLHVADFSINDGLPSLSNAQIYQPGGYEVMYENHGFSPDGTKLIFSSNTGIDNEIVFVRNDIHTYNLQTEELITLTSESYNEHAIYSPDGTKIIWMTDVCNANKGTDFWMMDADGSNKRRLSFFNDGNALTKKITCADNSWSADGKSFIGFYASGPTHAVEKDALFELSELITSIKDINFLEESTLVYPNPVSGLATLEITSPSAGPFSLRIYDAMGVEHTFIENIDSSKINLSAQLYMEGIYFYQISDGKDFISEGKFIVQK